MKSPIHHSYFSILLLFSALFVVTFHLPSKAQTTACNTVRPRTVDTITYATTIEEEGLTAISIQRQFGLHKNSAFDYIAFTITISFPLKEADSLGIIKHHHVYPSIVLSDNSIIETSAASESRVNEYISTPKQTETGYRCGGLNPYPVKLIYETESIQIILTQDQLKRLQRYKIKDVKIKDSVINISNQMGNAVTEKIACIAQIKPYSPAPKIR